MLVLVAVAVGAMDVGAAAAKPKSTPVADLEKAQWIWGESSNSICHLRKVFTVDDRARSASVLITADNGYDLYVNGSRVGSDVGIASDVWQSVERYDITSRLTKGRNIIGIQGTDLGGIRGVLAAVRIEIKGKPAFEVYSDNTWRAAPGGKPLDYSHPEFVEGAEWQDARVVGPMGMAPWGKVAWSQQAQLSQTRLRITQPDQKFSWPQEVAFVGDDCSVYVPLRGDAWGVCFRVEDWSRAYTEFDLPCPSKIGRKLYALKPGPAAKPRLLVDAGKGVLGSPSVSFDGQSLLIAMARPGEKFFHVYRVPASGGEPQKLTEGPFHDIDPVELPDGRIVFTSTRLGTYEEYHQPPARGLFRMNADGSGIHQITSTPIFDNEAKVMADGRIVFIRTDNFFDRGKVETHLHAMRPDGTDGLTEIGANVGADYGVRLRAFGYGSPAPLPDGRLAFIARTGNAVASAGEPERHYHPLPSQLGDVTSLPDGRVLCTVLRPDGSRMSSDVLAVINPADDRIVGIFESTVGPIHSPVFLGSRQRPPVIPDFVSQTRTNELGATGFLFCQNARFTTKTKADWDRIRAIRVLGAIPLTVRSSHSHIVHVGHETVELGTVPLAADGSFFVEVPADMPLALQAVDAEGRSELNEMSWLYVRPGERRSCVGCHNPRQSSPPLTAGTAEALRAAPLKLVGQGSPHHFRGNNPGVTGMMDLQFERFRECASLNLNGTESGSLASTKDDIAALRAELRGNNAAEKISAAERLALFRSQDSASDLVDRLKHPDRQVRVSAAFALAACGTRASIPALLGALEDNDATVARAADIALENLTGHSEPVTSAGISDRKAQAQRWATWFVQNSWDQIQKHLVDELHTSNAPVRSIVVALGHIGDDAARTALRDFVAVQAQKNPYPVFDKNNRTDTFTFSAESPLNPRTLQEAVRALGHLHDTNALPLFRELLVKNIDPATGNLFLAEAIIESLGRIGTPDAEHLLVDTFARLKDYWDYVGWYSDHPALYACHSSPIHARIIEALDLIGSIDTAKIVPQLIRSIPTDPDRGLFLDNDNYERLVGRLIRRSGRGQAVIDTCLALLGDPRAIAQGDLKTAISTTHPAWAGHPGPENRAAQVLSLVCREPATEPQVRAAFERFRAMPEETVQRPLGNPTWTPVRHWVLFYLGRTLGNLSDAASVETLTSVLGDELNEARHGRPDPSQPEIHFLHLEYTPCWRAAAAWALGKIGDLRAGPVLLGVVRNLENATDVRHAAAEALGRLADPSLLPQLKKLAQDYPEVSTRRALLAASSQIENSKAVAHEVAQQSQ